MRRAIYIINCGCDVEFFRPVYFVKIKNIIWLKGGIEGDDTDGHVDDVARFVNKNTIVCMIEENTDDKNYTPLKENFDLLKNTTFCP